MRGSALEALEAATELAFSVVSLAEIGIKTAIGKLNVPRELREHIVRRWAKLPSRRVLLAGIRESFVDQARDGQKHRDRLVLRFPTPVHARERSARPTRRAHMHCALCG